MANKYLDNTGLSYLWGKIKAIVPTKVSDLTNDSNYATQTWVQNYLAGRVTQDANGFIVLDDSE